MQILGIMISFLYLWFFLFLISYYFFPCILLRLVGFYLLFLIFFSLNYLHLCFSTSPSPPRILPVPVGKENGEKLILFRSADENPEVAHREIQRDRGRSAVAVGVFFVSSFLQELLLSESRGLGTGKGSEILARNRKQVTWSSFYPTETWGRMGVPSKCDSKARN